MPCPDCSYTSRFPGSVQLCLLPCELELLTAKAAPYGRLAQRCAHCGLVYARAPTSRRLGWLDGIKGRGFHPALSYA